MNINTIQNKTLSAKHIIVPKVNRKFPIPSISTRKHTTALRKHKLSELKQKLKKRERTVKLDRGWYVPRWVLKRAYKSILAYLPYMRPGHPLTAQSISGKRLWKNWIYRKYACFCFAHLTRQQLVPIKFSDKTGSTNQFEIDMDKR